MIKINFKDKYKVLHLTHEFGNDIAGGIHTYISEHYKYKKEDIGFIHCLRNREILEENYINMQDVLALKEHELIELENLDFEILVIHSFDFAQFITKKAIKNKKVIYVIHSVPAPEPLSKTNPFGGWYDAEFKLKVMCSYSDVIVCISEAEKQKLLTVCPHIDATKVVRIYNGLTLPENINFAPLKSRKKLGLISRLEDRKGFIEAFKAIKDLDVELHIACDLYDLTYLRSMIQCITLANLWDRVHFYNFCIGERKEAFLNYVDAIILPSLYEPFGYTTIEPLLYGKPIISSNNGGIGEIIGEEYKYQFYPYRPDEFENAIKSFLNDDESEIKKEFDKLVDRLPIFDGKKMIENYEKIYEDILK